MLIVRRLLSFMSISSRQKPTVNGHFSGIGQHFWWFAPVYESIVIFIIAQLSISLNLVVDSPYLTAAIFLSLDHGIHGLRRLDGFADLWEGIFYQSIRPKISHREIWEVVRSPLIGVFGATAIFLFLLIQWNIVAELMRTGSREFLLAALLSAVMSKVSVATAMSSPAKFRKESLFTSMSVEISRPLNILLICLACTILSLSFSLIAMNDIKYIILAPGILALAAVTGMLAKSFILKRLKMLNGDIIGFAWCTAEVIISLTLLILFKWWLKA